MIKEILNEISNEPGSNAKMDILMKYHDNELLKKVMYHALSGRVKFYLKAIPQFLSNGTNSISLDYAIDQLGVLSRREKTGHDAANHVRGLLASLYIDNAYVLTRIIDKDLKIGMGRSNINKVIPKLIERTPYMGAKAYSEKLAKAIFAKGQVGISQIKMDGRYANAIINNGEVDLVSRQGETTHIGNAQLMQELSGFDDCVLNGELTMDNEPDRLIANGIITSIVDIEGKRETRTYIETENKIKAFEEKHGAFQESLDHIRFTVWDMVSLDEYFNEKSSKPYSNRLSVLETLIGMHEPEKITLVESKKVETFAEAMEHFQDSLSRGLEGTVLKTLTGTWKHGKPNWQVKMKLEMNIDLKIIGFQYGSKGTKNETVISTLITESSDGLLKTNPSGMKEDMMKYVTGNQESLLGTIVEIRCCGLSQDKTGNWSTLHPSVVELRNDKNDCDTLKSAQETEEMSKSLS